MDPLWMLYLSENDREEKSGRPCLVSFRSKFPIFTQIRKAYLLPSCAKVARGMSSSFERLLKRLLRSTVRIAGYGP